MHVRGEARAARLLLQFLQLMFPFHELRAQRVDLEVQALRSLLMNIRGRSETVFDLKLRGV